MYQFVQNFPILFSILLIFGCSEKTKTQTPSPQVNFDFIEKFPAEERGIVYQSFNQGKTWQSIKGNLPNDIQIQIIALKDDKLIISSENYGIFIKGFSEENWTQISEQLPAKKITYLFVEQNKIYACLYHKGLYLTENEGKTWCSLNENLTDLEARSVHIFNNKIFLGTNSGLFMKEKGSQNCNKIFDEGQVLEIRSTNNKIIAGTNRGVIYSENYGETWKWILKGKPIHNFALFDNRIFNMYIGHGMEMSDNWGKSWQKFGKEFAGYAYTFDLEKVGNKLVASHHDGIFQSDDFGQTWNEVFPTPTEKFRDLITDGNMIFGGTVKRD